MSSDEEDDKKLGALVDQADFDFDTDFPKQKFWNNKYNNKNKSNNLNKSYTIGNKPNYTGYGYNNKIQFNNTKKTYYKKINSLNINTNQPKIGNQYIPQYNLKKKYYPFPDNKINLTDINIKQDNNDAMYIKLKMKNLQNEIRRDKLYVNLIFYDENKTNENKFIYDQLQLNVVGYFYGLRDINVLRKLLAKLDKNTKPFILISSGSCFRKVYSAALYSKSIQSMIIYCMNKAKYIAEFKNFKKLELIENDFDEVKQYLKTKRFTPSDIKMELNKEINYNPLISLYEYKNCYFVFHKALSFFFKEDFSEPIFNEDYLNEAIKCVQNDEELESYDKNSLTNSFKYLNQSNNFAKDALIEYTKESPFYRYINKTLRRIESGILRLSFLIGPMYYAFLRNAKKNIFQVLHQNTTLYRNIKVDEEGMNFFYMEVGNIICFPAFTSTSFNNKFYPTKSGDNTIKIEMSLQYEHYYNNEPIGIILGQNAYFPGEEEVLLFPFTFIKVINLEKIDDLFYKMYCKIINRSCVLEFGLKNDKKISIFNDTLTTSY